MKKQTILLIVLTLALALSVTVNVVLWVLWPKEAAGPSTGEVVDQTTTAPTETEPKEMIDINTPYGVVKFPETFTNVEYEASQQENTYTIAFWYLRAEEAIPVFSVHFGDAEQGTRIGNIEAEGELIPFSVTSAPAFDNSAWTAEEQEQFNAVTMAVNDVIASVQAWDTYVG